MKSYKAILNEIKKNRANYDLTMEQINNTHDKDAQAVLSANLERLSISYMILRDNYTYALATAAINAAVEVFAKYDGKPYGEMTEKNTSREMRKRGFSFWFHRYSWGGKDSDSANIYAVDDNGYICRDEASIYSGGTVIDENGKTRRLDFITSDNKINLEAIKGAKIQGEYCENIPKRVKEIQKAYKKYCDSIGTAYAAQSELNHLLPSRIDNLHNVTSQYVNAFRF